MANPVKPSPGSRPVTSSPATLSPPSVMTSQVAMSPSERKLEAQSPITPSTTVSQYFDSRRLPPLQSIARLTPPSIAYAAPSSHHLTSQPVFSPPTVHSPRQSAPWSPHPPRVASFAPRQPSLPLWPGPFGGGESAYLPPRPPLFPTADSGLALPPPPPGPLLPPPGFLDQAAVSPLGMPPLLPTPTQTPIQTPATPTTPGGRPRDPAVPLVPQYSFRHTHPTLVRPFECDQCPLAFARNHDLKRHRRLHEPVKPFSCDVCGKKISRKDALMVRIPSPSS